MSFTEWVNYDILALTAVERLEAIGKYESNFMADRWFILVGIIAIVTLTVVLGMVSFKRVRNERESSKLCG